MSAGAVVPFPLTLASNVFVRPATMPGWLQAVVRVNPVSQLVTGERGLMAGHAAPGQIAWVLLAAGALTAVFGAGRKLVRLLRVTASGVQCRTSVLCGKGWDSGCHASLAVRAGDDRRRLSLPARQVLACAV